MPPSDYLQDATGRGLLKILPEIAGSSRLLNKAIASLATAFLAQQNGDRHLLQYSTKLYGDAIQTLNGKIRTGEDIGKDVLYTTVIFQFYEVSMASTVSSRDVLTRVVDKLLATGILGADRPCPRQ